MISKNTLFKFCESASGSRDYLKKPSLIGDGEISATDGHIAIVVKRSTVIHGISDIELLDDFPFDEISKLENDVYGKESALNIPQFGSETCGYCGGKGVLLNIDALYHRSSEEQISVVSELWEDPIFTDECRCHGSGVSFPLDRFKIGREFFNVHYLYLIKEAFGNGLLVSFAKNGGVLRARSVNSLDNEFIYLAKEDLCSDKSSMNLDLVPDQPYIPIL